MAKGITIEVRGLKALQKRIGAIATDVIAEVDGVMHVAANDYVNRAVNDAPVDEGLLRQGISEKRVKVLDYEIVSAADYSAYIEFGTKSKAVIPADLTEYAAQFRGKGGGGNGFFEKILAWVKRKGIGATPTKSGRASKGKKAQQAQYDVARSIYFSILKNGVKGHPFFFKHRDIVYATLKKDIGPAVKNALKK